MRTQNKKLRERRNRAGLLQVQLASLAGVSIGTLNKLENWNFPVSKPTADKLAKALNCKPSEIFPDGNA